MLHRHCGTERATHALFAYEGTVDSAPDAVEHWSEIMVQLGLWAAPDLERVRNRGATGTHAVHAVMPLSQVVANYAEVADTLRGGVFEWMLGEDRRRLSSDCALPEALAHPFLGRTIGLYTVQLLPLAPDRRHVARLVLGVPLQNFDEILAFFGCDPGHIWPEAIDLLLGQGAQGLGPRGKTIRAVPAGLFTHP